MNRVEPNRNVYVGHRYVPLLVGEWDKSIQYEGLSIVTFKGASYTSKKMTPPGIDIENEEFWVLTGNYNAQIEYYRMDVERVQEDMSELDDRLTKDLNDTREYVDDEVRETKEYVDSNVQDLTIYVNDSVEKINKRVDKRGLDLESESNGVTDVTDDIQNWLDSEENNLFVPKPNESYLSSQINLNNTKKIHGNHSLFKVNGSGERLFNISNPSERIDNSFVEKLNVTQPESTQGGTGTENNHFSLAFAGTVNGTAMSNIFKDVDLGISFGYGNINLDDRTGLHNLTVFNYMENVKNMGIQNIGVSYGRTIGNGIEGKGSTSHGLRYTGYDEEDITAPSKGHVASSNVINGVRNAISLQNTSKYNSIGETSVHDVSHALIQTHEPTKPENYVSFNSVHNLTFEKAYKGIVNYGGGFNYFNIIGENIYGGRLVEDISSTRYDLSGNNHYDIIVKDVLENGMLLRYPNNNFNVDLTNVNGTGVNMSLDSHGNRGKIKVKNANKAVSIFSNDNILEIHSSEVTGNSVEIAGDDNIITVNTDSDVLITGKNNTVRGIVKGEVKFSGEHENNDISDIQGYKGNGYEQFKTTDENGEYTFPHGLKSGNLWGTIQTRGDTPFSMVNIKSITDTDVTVKFIKPDGQPLSDTVVWFYWDLQYRIRG